MAEPHRRHRREGMSAEQARPVGASACCNEDARSTMARARGERATEREGGGRVAAHYNTRPPNVSPRLGFVPPPLPPPRGLFTRLSPCCSHLPAGYPPAASIPAVDTSWILVFPGPRGPPGTLLSLAYPPSIPPRYSRLEAGDLVLDLLRNQLYLA